MKTNIFSNKITSVLVAVIVCALWGSLFPCIKIGYKAFEISGSDIPSIILFAVFFSGIILLEDIFRITYLAAFVIILSAILISNIRRSDKQ